MLALYSLSETAYEGDDPGSWKGYPSPADHPCDSKANDTYPAETRYGVSVGTLEGAWFY